MSREAAARYLLERIEEVGLTPREVAEQVGKTYMAGRLWTIGENKDGEKRFTIPSTMTLQHIAKVMEKAAKGKKVEGFDMEKYLAIAHSEGSPQKKEKFIIGDKSKKVEDKVSDDGMSPELKYGYALELKQITMDDVVPGHIYFVVVNDNKLARIIRQSKTHSSKFILVPSNTEKYDPWEVEKSKISAIYKILSFKGTID